MKIRKNHAVLILKEGIHHLTILHGYDNNLMLEPFKSYIETSFNSDHNTRFDKEFDGDQFTFIAIPR